MVNIHGCTRMMVNRCIELLRARIECAQTRHIARRHPGQRVTSSAQYRPEEQLVRERAKTDTYQKNKRRSMWEQDGGQGARSAVRDDQQRLDADQYRPRELEQRSYDCTWENFPESVAERPPSIDMESADVMPRRRRSESERPNTAKPWDEEARDFISQWDSNAAMINRQRYSQAVGVCPPPMSSNMANAMRSRQRQFYY
ncbi:hypothetical protein KR009_003227 [Drosophila setifemur]|nr:hypothetical protein KR009_003227 [Drosophila setifemur]